ncbi:MAG: Aminopeptidase T [Syntrophorhabdus sp. PtaU1.Bin058]|nr:MAG: Aminopeptidase T [Syntrophorhabdus sp. PtaU1.Bin058]
MLTDKQLSQYAEVLLWGLETARKKPFKKNDCVLLQYEAPATRLAEILYGRILDLGMHPVQRMGLTFGMEKDFYKRSKGKQLTFITPGDRELYANLNGRIFVRAPASLTHLKEIDPARIGKVLVSRKPLRDILDKREEQGRYSWTLCTFPTTELARQAKASPQEYAQQIIRACYLDRKDPVGEWKKVHKQAGIIKQWLSSLKVSYFHVESEHVDLKIAPGEKRQWKGISGHNIPSFEVFLSPDWHGTEGVYYANLPSFRSGNYVEKIRITFQKGSVVKMEAAKGEDFARKQLSMDKGACRVGEFSLTDRRFSRIDRFMADTLFDENFGGEYGNCHVALGASYTDTYKGNPAAMTGALKKKLGFNDSALHWDLVNTEDKTVTAHLASGRNVVIYEKGVFKY